MIVLPSVGAVGHIGICLHLIDDLKSSQPDIFLLVSCFNLESLCYGGFYSFFPLVADHLAPVQLGRMQVWP